MTPGLTCARCLRPFERAVARRTRLGFVHRDRCEIPQADLERGRWVRAPGSLVLRWTPEAAA